MPFNVIAVSSLLWIVTVQATPTGNHTCTGVVKHSVTVRVNVTEPVTYRTYTWCLRVPPRCSKYTVQLKDRIKIHTEMHNRTITVCCKGYVEMDYKCVPACPPQTECPNMHCNRTNHCYCTPGYQGLYCNYPCDRGFWGPDCKKACDCPDGFTCHHLTGDCMLDVRPPTTKYRRTTTTTVATLSPETTFARTTATTTVTTTMEPSTETTTTELTTPSTTTPKTTTVPPTSRLTEQTSLHTTSPQTSPITSTVASTSSEAVVSTKTYTTPITERPVVLHTISEIPKVVSILNSNLKSTTTEEPTTIESVTISSTTQSAKQPFTSNSDTLETTRTTTNANLLIKSTPSVSSTVSAVEQDSRTHSTVISTPTYSVETLHPVFIGNISENSLPFNIISVAPSTMPTEPTTPTTSATFGTTYVPSTEPTSTSTMATSPRILSTISTPVPQPSTEITSPRMPILFSLPFTTISTIPTTTSTSPTTIQTISYSTQESTKPIETSFSVSFRNITGTEASTASTPLNVTPTISKIYFKEDNLSFNENIDFIPTKFQTNVPTTQLSEDSERTTKLTETVLPFSEGTVPVYTTVAIIPKESSTQSEATATTLLEILPSVESIAKTVNTAVDVTTKFYPTRVDFTVKNNSDSIINFYESTTESIKRIEEKNKEEFEGKNMSQVFSNILFDKENGQVDTAVVTHLDSTITSTSLQPILSTTTEPIGSTVADAFSSVISNIDKSVVEPEISRISTSTSKSATDSTNYTITNNDNLPVVETTENDKYEDNFKMSNVMRKSYKNGTNLISSANDVSTKFGQPYFDLGKSISEIKIKQKPEITTTLATKEEASMRNTWLTTNSRPAHTWYSHVKEYQKKTKNKEDMKVLKATSHIELLSVTEKYDISEESNIIDSMQTSYTERGSKGNSGAPPPVVNEEANIASTYVRHGQIKYNLSSALAEEVQAGRSDKSLFTLYSTSTLISGIALILLISSSTALWLCLRKKREPTTLKGPCIMAYGPPNEFSLNPLMYETVYPLGPIQGERCVDPEIFFCPTFTNNYAEKINRELSELSYDHPRSSICEPLYAEIRY